MSASTLPSSLCNCISPAVSTSWPMTPRATPNCSNACAVIPTRTSFAKPPAVTNKRSCGPCRRPAFPSASSKRGASATSPAPKASAPRLIPLMPPCCPHTARRSSPPPPPRLQFNSSNWPNLAQRRRQLIQLLVSERNHAEHYTDSFRLRQSRQLVKALEKKITQCDEAITSLIAQDTELARKAERLKAIPGVGPVVAATMLAEMPELGKLTTQTAAALAGVAPYNRDSGGQTGVRRINGGRAAVRCALYMATLSAVRHDRILKEFYLRLRAAGKKPLVAMTACMRKLVILMNRLLKNNDFQLAS